MKSREDAVRAVQRALAPAGGRTRIERPGKVSAVLSATAAMVALDGASRPVRVRVPMLPDPLVVGDVVLVEEWSDGSREITRIRGREPVVVDPDPEPTIHDLETHELLGLLSLEDFATHAVGTTHLHTYNTPNTYATADGWWTQIASGTIPQRWGSVAFHAILDGTGSNTAAWVRGTIRGRIRQQDDLGSQPLVTIELLDAVDIDPEDVAVVVTSVVEATVFSVHLRVTREYEWVEWIPLWVRADRCDFEWTGCQAFTSSLPAGTATDAVSGDIVVVVTA